MEYHLPILLTEVLGLLSPKPGKTYIDATLGNGGHTVEILKTGATVFGLDQDPNNLTIATDRIRQLNLSTNFHPIHTNFSQLSSLNIKTDGILFDLGLSQNQLKASGRGFSFNDPDSLDMRLDPAAQSTSALDIINTYSLDQLFDIFSKYSQETNSRKIAQLITQNRPITSASQLADLISKNFPQRTKIHPATKIIMALRIAANQEYANLKSALNQTLSITKHQGVVCVISFHSGEDRIIKQFINQSPVRSLTPKPISPSRSEITFNPLSRSAKLRAYRIE